MLRKAGSLLFTWIILFIIAVHPVLAQNYRFQVPLMDVSVFANKDGTVSIDYMIEFANDPGASPIDFVDIGLPTADYDLRTVTATINGAAIRNITKSDYIKNGIALGLGANAIRAGQRGKVQARINTVRKMIYKANTKEAEPYASFQFSPTWFDGKFAHGKTSMTVTLYLPEGLNNEEPRYFPPKPWAGGDKPESGFDSQGRVFYRWKWDGATPYTQYTFGAAFPARLVASNALVTEPLINIDLEEWLPGIFCMVFGGFWIFLPIWGVIASRKRKLQYLPPKISIEGHGIKRGLTAIEAAILMESPVDKVLTMLLFSVLKKGAARVITREPLKLEIPKIIPEELQSYEKKFLSAMSVDDNKARRTRLQALIVDLVKEVAEKMRGFSRRETVAYYEDIMRRAWQQVESADTPEMKMEKYDEQMEWTMLDRRFTDRTRDVFGPRPVYVPTWWWRYDPNISRPSSPSTPQGNVPVSLPSLPGSDFAASVVNGIQSFSAGIVGNVNSFTEGITQKTNPIPVSRSSSGRSGGSGCACACACAGCACACAGGGR